MLCCGLLSVGSHELARSVIGGSNQGSESQASVLVSELVRIELFLEKCHLSCLLTDA